MWVQKSACTTKRCRCRKLENLCTTLCSCVGCKNDSESQITTQEEENNDDKEVNDEDDQGEGDEESEDELNDENDADQDEEEFNGNIDELDELDFDIDFVEFQKELYAMARKPFMVSADDQSDDECDISNSDVLV